MKKSNLIASIFVLFLAIVIIVMSSVIYSTPAEVVSGTAGNYTINLSNGGYVVEDNGFLFYTYPNKNGIYRINSDNMKDKKKITDEGNGFLQNVKNAYYFTSGNSLKLCDWNGERRQTVLKYARKPLIVGSLIFYLDKNGSLCKYSMQNKSSSVIIDSSKNIVNEFVVYYKRIYYTDQSGNIRKLNFDGTKDSLFISAKASNLSIDGQYIFYIENGSVFSAMLKEKEILKTKIVKANQYAVFGSAILYTDGEKTYFADINKLVKDKNKAEIKKVFNGNATGISIDENYFYFFSDNGVFKRISHEGKNLIDIK